MPEARLGKAFVNLADALVNGYETLDFLYLLCDRCRDVLQADAAGVLLSTDDDTLQLTAAAPEDDDVLELCEMQSQDGPCRDAFTTGKPVIQHNLAAAFDRWPDFAPRALEFGFHAVFAFPLHLRDPRIGALTVLRYGSGSFDERDLQVGQALADVATIGVVQDRMVRQAYQRSEQLQAALNSRVLIEQAKGVLAERLAVELGTAFETMRRHARNHSRPLRAVCQAVIDGDLTLG